jgi:hypothetical protein
MIASLDIKGHYWLTFQITQDIFTHDSNEINFDQHISSSRAYFLALEIFLKIYQNSVRGLAKYSIFPHW